MRPDVPSSRRLAAPLTYRIDDDATAAQIAAAVGTLWIELDAALSPIIGPRGVAALGQRSLHLASAAHPWLAAGRSDQQPAVLDAASLTPLLAARGADQAAAAGSLLLQTFHELLASLIGPSLTERLLRPVWGPPLAPA